MSDPRFLQKGFDKQLAHLIEECGEVLAAAGKTQRWGPRGTNPLLPGYKQEENAHWLWRELQDLKEAIGRLERTMQGTGYAPPSAHTGVDLAAGGDKTVYHCTRCGSVHAGYACASQANGGE